MFASANRKSRHRAAPVGLVFFNSIICQCKQNKNVRKIKRVFDEKGSQGSEKVR